MCPSRSLWSAQILRREDRDRDCCIVDPWLLRYMDLNRPYYDYYPEVQGQQWFTNKTLMLALRTMAIDMVQKVMQRQDIRVTVTVVPRGFWFGTSNISRFISLYLLASFGCGADIGCHPHRVFHV